MKLATLFTAIAVLGAGFAVAQDDVAQVQEQTYDYAKLSDFYKAYSLINDMNSQNNPGVMRALQFYDYQRNQEVSKFWIGVQCVEASSTKVNSDIPIDGQLSYDGGLLVNSVTDDSPAASARIKVGDVIVAFNEEQTNDVISLVAAIVAAGETECPVQVLRDGEFKELKVTPAKREQEEDQANNQQYETDSRLVADSRVALAKAWLAGGKLPKDLKLTITIENGDDVELRVQRDDKVWEVGGDNLNELPEDVQPHVGSILNSIRSNSIYSRYQLAQPWLQRQQMVQPSTLLQSRKAVQPYIRSYDRLIGKRPTVLANPKKSEKDRIDELSDKIDELTDIIMQLKKEND